MPKYSAADHKTHLALSTLFLLIALMGCGGGSSPGLIMQKPGTAPVASREDALAQLAAAPLPAGVDAALFQQLKDELQRTLLSLDGSPADPFTRQASAPGGPADAAVLSLDESGTSLSWYLENPGDYDQNGIVGISDLTPLGINYGMRIPVVPGAVAFALLSEDPQSPFDHSRLPSVVDGDGNGEIGIADVTTIGQNFGRRLLGYRVYASTQGPDYPAAPSAVSTVAPIAELELADATGLKSEDRLAFSLPLSPEQQGLGYWVRPLYETGEGSPSKLQGMPLSYPDGSLSLLGSSPASAQPGTVLTLTFNQPVDNLTEQLSLRPDWVEGEEFLLGETAVVNGNMAYMHVPLLLPGQYSYSLLHNGTELGTISLQIQQAATSLTPATLAQKHELSVEGFKVVADPAAAGLLGYYPEEFDYAALRSELDKFDEVFDVLFTWIDTELQELSPAEQQQVLGYLDNIGYTGLMDSLSVDAMQTSRADAGVSWNVDSSPWDGRNFERLYYDAWSSQVTNGSFLFDLTTISLSLFNPNAGFTFGAYTMVLGVQKSIIDICFPTDLTALDLAMNNRQRLVTGEPYQLEVWGHFYSEKKPSASQTLEALISSFVGAMPLPGYLKSEMLQTFTDYVIVTGANMGVAYALDAVLPTSSEPESPWDGHVDGGWVLLDAFLYEDDNPDAIYRKLGFKDKLVPLDQSEDYYRNQQYPKQFPLRTRQNPGDFLRSGGGGFTYLLGEAGQSSLTFSGTGRVTLFVRGFSFQSSESLSFWSHSYPETVSRKVDLWVGKDSDWQLHEVLSDTSLVESSGGSVTLKGQLMEAAEYPLILAEIAGGPLDGSVAITAQFQSGAGWDEPLDLAFNSAVSAGHYLGLPAITGSQAYLVANSAAGTSWPSSGYSLPAMSGEINTAELFAYQFDGGSPLRPAMLRSEHHGRTSVSLRDEIGGDWSIVSDVDFPNADNAVAAMIDGRPAVAYSDSYYEGVHPQLVLTRVDVMYAAALDSLGTSWGEPTLVCSTERPEDDDFLFLYSVDIADVGGSPSILLGADTPPIYSSTSAYHDGLYMSSSASALGGSWSAPAPIQPVRAWDDYFDPHILVTRGCLTEIGGRPAVAYSNNGTTYYCQALDNYGNSWPQPEPVALSFTYTSQGSPTLSLAQINNFPAILLYQGEEPEPTPISLLTDPGLQPRVLSNRLVYATP